MTGDEEFERMHRVHMNTLETLVAFLPSLFLAAIYWPGLLVAALGAVYLSAGSSICAPMSPTPPGALLASGCR